MPSKQNTDPRKELTLILAKPDALQRGLVGEIIRRFETKGFKVVALKMTQPSRDHVHKHYLPTKQQLEGMGNKTLENFKKHGIDPVKQMGSSDPMKIGEIINDWNVDFLSSGPVVAMVFQGLHAVEMGRKIVGATIPANAEMGTLRGDYSSDSPLMANAAKRTIRNLVHASGDVAEASREIKHWFTAKELHDYARIDEGLLF
ncbi:MAG: nucleoside-diphosphate kinase [Patescibacteria group bacterium]